MKNYKKWTETELQYIKSSIATCSDGILAAKLSDMTGETISTAMIRRQRRKLGINKPRGRPKKNVTLSANDTDNA